MTILRIQRLHEQARLPTQATVGSSGFDLCACLPDGPVVVWGGNDIDSSAVSIGCGFAMELEPGYEGQVRPRSGFAAQGLLVPNSPGTLDSDYRGEIRVLLRNLGHRAITITHGDRIAQLVVAAVPQVTVIEVEVLSATARDVGGFGSTGVS